MRRAILLATMLVACAPKKKAPELPLPAEKLPAVFAPIEWTTSLADLAKKYPKKPTDVTRYTGIDGKKMVAETLLDVEWPIIGPSLVTLTRAPGEAASQIRIEGNGGVRAPVAHNAELAKRFDALRAELEKTYGPAHAKEVSGSPDLPRDEREITVSWSREGFVVFASIERTEFDGWVVALYAVRRGAPL